MCGNTARLSALEKSARKPTPHPSSAFSERRVSELEEDLAQAKRKLGEQDDRIRELQIRLQAQTEKAAIARLADRQELSELVQRAINEHMRKNLPARPCSSSEAPARAWISETPQKGALSPARIPGSDHLSWSQTAANAARLPLDTSMSAVPGVRADEGNAYRGSASRVMEESQQRVQEMRRDSMQRSSPPPSAPRGRFAGSPCACPLPALIAPLVPPALPMACFARSCS